jgi:hypothetical protein
MVLTTMSATGLRVGEAVQLSVNDIDSRRMTILVARGKGNKQRLVPLSPKLLTELRLFWQTHRNPVWLFPSRLPGPASGHRRGGQKLRESQAPCRTDAPLQHACATALCRVPDYADFALPADSKSGESLGFFAVRRGIIRGLPGRPIVCRQAGTAPA